MTDPGAARQLRHELRTPVNQILGYAELLMEEAEDSGLKDWSADLDEIRSSGKRLLSLIDLVAETRNGRATRQAVGDLLGLAREIAAACDTLERGLVMVEDREGLVADLARIRAAANRLALLIEARWPGGWMAARAS